MRARMLLLMAMLARICRLCACGRGRCAVAGALTDAKPDADRLCVRRIFVERAARQAAKRASSRPAGTKGCQYFHPTASGSLSPASTTATSTRTSCPPKEASRGA